MPVEEDKPSGGNVVRPENEQLVRCGEVHCIIVARRQVRHCWRLKRGAGEGVVIRADYSYHYIHRTIFLVIRVIGSHHNRKAAVERAVSACFAEVVGGCALFGE
jgi:hypothetical protein